MSHNYSTCNHTFVGWTLILADVWDLHIPHGCIHDLDYSEFRHSASNLRTCNWVANNASGLTYSIFSQAVKPSDTNLYQEHPQQKKASSAFFSNQAHYHFAEFILSAVMYLLSVVQHSLTAQGHYVWWRTSAMKIDESRLMAKCERTQPASSNLETLCCNRKIWSASGHFLSRGWERPHLLCWQWTPLKPGGHLHT